MVSAYVLITVESGKEKKTLQKLLKLKEVKKGNVVYGAYDIVLYVETDSLKELQDLIGKKIREIKDVTQTSTMITWDYATNP